MSDSSVPPSLALRPDLPRKVLLLILLIIDTAIAIFFLFRLRPETHLLVRQIFADLTMGLVTGFGARILLRRRSWFVRFISAAAALIIGLLVLGVLTKWRSGFGPLVFWRDTIDWIGLAQITLGMTSMFLAMLAWSKPAQASTNRLPAAPVTPAPFPPKVHPKAQTRTRQKRKRTKPALIAGVAPHAAVPKNEPVRTELPVKPVITRKPTAKTESKPAPRIFLRKPQVRLLKVEKHLCPFCLEPVVRKDPRGIVKCEICHTLHHADCWAIAGSCQVPHYTA